MAEPTMPRMNLSQIVKPAMTKHQWDIAYRCYSIYEGLAWKSTEQECQESWSTMALEDRQNWLCVGAVACITLLQAVNGELERPTASAGAEQDERKQG